MEGVGCRYIGAVGEEELNHFGGPVAGCDVERCLSVDVLGVHLRAGLV